MCRLLLVVSREDFDAGDCLGVFSDTCRTSPEYQGHGWGAMLGGNGGRRIIKHPDPIWEHEVGGLGDTRFLLAHARSAFRDGPVAVEYNMPFVDDRYAFVFNGELHGVRLGVDGKTGAEKIFNLFRRLDNGDTDTAFRRTIEVVTRRTRYIRAMNMILTDGHRAWVCAHANEQPDYFTLHIRRAGPLAAVCSVPLEGFGAWTPIANHSVEVVPCC
jgi:glutamine amidotransferase